MNSQPGCLGLYRVPCISGPELAKLPPSVTYGLEIGPKLVFCRVKSVILEKHEAQNVLFRFFTALITSFGAGLAAFVGDNEIEDEFYLVLPVILSSIWHHMVASLGLGLVGD